MRRGKFLAALCFFFWISLLGIRAQNTQDSSATLNSRPPDGSQKFKSELWPNPKKAVQLSLLFPGLGQAYNKRYWKIPIVYGALGAGLFFAFQSHKQYTDFRNAYRARVDNDSLTIDPYVAQYPNPQTLLVFRDFHRRNRDLSIILCFVGYALGAIEAYVDAHLRNFEVSENLSLGFSPLSWQAILTYRLK
jgi:hypothetical protein